MKNQKIRNGVSQLTMVEHALCPLDSRSAMQPNQIHSATFKYSDKAGERQTAKSQIFCPLGLSPKDELILWGLLSVTLATGEGEGELHATRHYCLRRLGIIDQNSRRGGRQYSDFTAAIRRLSAIRYQCSALYDPMRGEHRHMGFGFFSYSIPIDGPSDRAWRFVWDPVFFELIKADGGFQLFNFDVYSQLDAGSGRLYQFLSKLFYRKRITQRLSVVDVAEQIIGIAPSVQLRDKKTKLMKYLKVLQRHGVVRDVRVTRPSKGHFFFVASRGPLFESARPEQTFESPLFEPLLSIGFDRRGANRLLRRFKHIAIRDWLDITLAARDRFGKNYFRNSAAAFLTDNLKMAAAGERTPPDWWHSMRKQEQRAAADRASKFGQDTSTTKEGDTIGSVLDSVFQTFVSAGQSEQAARKNEQRYRRAARRRSRTNSQ